MNGDVGRSEPEPPPLARKIQLERTSEGYGFNLHGEKGIHGQFISAIDEGSPAQLNDVRVGDRVIAVNDEDVEELPHSKVVEKIRANGSHVTLLLVDEQCDEYYKTLGVKIPQDKYETVIPKGSEIVEPPVSNGGEEVPEILVVPEQNGEVESSPPPPEPAPVLEEQSEEKPTESVEKQNDEYEEVVPLASSSESAPKPVETTPAVEEAVEEKASTVPPTTTTTTTTTSTATSEVQSPKASSQFNNFDKPAARAPPKRKEVKLATQDWKKKYEDFNKL